MEPESCPGALDAARAFGAELTTLEGEARAYYVMPSLSNPRGQPISPAARERLFERARRARAYIIEHDAYADRVFASRPMRGVPLSMYVRSTSYCRPPSCVPPVKVSATRTR